jgi:hypothetical protein
MSWIVTRYPTETSLGEGEVAYSQGDADAIKDAAEKDRIPCTVRKA